MFEGILVIVGYPLVIIPFKVLDRGLFIPVNGDTRIFGKDVLNLVVGEVAACSSAWAWSTTVTEATSSRGGTAWVGKSVRAAIETKAQGHLVWRYVVTPEKLCGLLDLRQVRVRVKDIATRSQS